MKALMYHYIREYNDSLRNLKFLHIQDFKKQLDYLGAEYGFVSQKNFLEFIKGNIPVPKGVVLTFDDGLKDHYKYVFPELKRLGLWGVFYISSGIFEQKKLLSVHAVHFLLAKYGSISVLNKLEVSGILDEVLFKEVSQAHDNKIYLHQKISKEEYIIKRLLNYSLDAQRKEEVCSYLIKAFDENDKELHKNTYLTQTEIKEMNDAGMIMGSHAVSHQPMLELTDNNSEKEITESFNFFKSLLDPKILTFCYPHGLPHTFGLREIHYLESLNIDFSFAVESRDITSEDQQKNIHSLPRYDCNEFKYGKAYNANPTP